MRCTDLFEQNLIEGRDAPLYHGTSFFNAKQIILAGEIGAFTSQTVAGKEVFGVSLTRDIRVACGFGDLIFVFDQKKLTHQHKLLPFSFFHKSDSRRLGPNAEAEEFLVGPIKPIDRYLVSIMVRWKALDRDELDDGNIVMRLNKYPDNQTFAAIAKHPLLKVVRNWPTG